MIANQRTDKGWRSLAQFAFNWKSRINDDDIIKGDSGSLITALGGIDSILYCLFLYARITDTYEESKTWEEYKTLYEYTTFKKLFAQYDIDLDLLAEGFFALETLADNGGTDDEDLINNTETIRSFLCGCVDPVPSEHSMTEPALLEISN